MISIQTGIDLVEIERIENLNPQIKERFLTRVFTVAELNQVNRSASSLSGRFAAKEAASKALGCGIGEIHWQDLEIIENPEGKPELLLHSAAALKAQKQHWTSWSVSVSHTRSQAVAVVTALIHTPEDESAS